MVPLLTPLHGQIHIINAAVDAAPRDSALRKHGHVQDPSDKAIECCIKALDYFIDSRRAGHTVADLCTVHQEAVALLEALKKNLPERVGTHYWNAKGEWVPIGWKIGKPHDMLHKVRHGAHALMSQSSDAALMHWQAQEIVRHGNAENTSANGPERAHKPLIKQLRTCASASHLFMTILRYHARKGMLSYIQDLLTQVARRDSDRDDLDDMRPDDEELVDDVIRLRSKSVTPGDLGISYPILQVAMATKGLHVRTAVR